MRLNKKIKSIVFTYEDEECSRLTGEEASKFQKSIECYVSMYQMMLNSYGTFDGEKPVPLQDLKYEVIRNGLLQKDIVVR